MKILLVFSFRANGFLKARNIVIQISQANPVLGRFEWTISNLLPTSYYIQAAGIRLCEFLSFNTRSQNNDKSCFPESRGCCSTTF